MPDTGNPQWDSQFGLKLQFLGETEEPISELENKEVGCIWTSYDQETKELKQEWISLKECIEKSESSEWWNELFSSVLPEAGWSGKTQKIERLL